MRALRHRRLLGGVTGLGPTGGMAHRVRRNSGARLFSCDTLADLSSSLYNMESGMQRTFTDTFVSSLGSRAHFSTLFFSLFGLGATVYTIYEVSRMEPGIPPARSEKETLPVWSWEDEKGLSRVENLPTLASRLSGNWADPASWRL